jgi:alpha-D-xyloside xylohydrolase
LIGGLTLSMSGFPFYVADTGGYRAPRPTKEDFIRWGQMTALSTIMQIGGPDPNVNPWDFTRYGDSQFDQQVLDNYRVYIRLHTRLFPYIYTYAKASARHERGATRPFGAAYPEEDHHPNDLFLLGDALLVAPIVDRSTSRNVRFPKGTIWFDWWEQTRYTEGERKLDAPLDRLLLFQRAGSIVPMLRDDIDTLSPVAVPDTVSFQPQAGLLSVRIAPGGNAQFALYDQTKIAWSEEKPAKISYEEGSVFREGALLEILRLTSPRRIDLNGTALSSVADQQALRACAGGCFLWDATTRILWLHIPSGSHTLTVDADPRAD